MDSTFNSAAAAPSRETRVGIRCDLDIIAARQKGRELASKVGFSSVELTLIATAISELARNIVLYARSGEINLKLVTNVEMRVMHIIACDLGLSLPVIVL